MTTPICESCEYAYMVYSGCIECRINEYPYWDSTNQTESCDHYRDTDRDGVLWGDDGK